MITKFERVVAQSVCNNPNVRSIASSKSHGGNEKITVFTETKRTDLVLVNGKVLIAKPQRRPMHIDMEALPKALKRIH